MSAYQDLLPFHLQETLLRDRQPRTYLSPVATGIFGDSSTFRHLLKPRPVAIRPIPWALGKRPAPATQP